MILEPLDDPEVWLGLTSTAWGAISAIATVLTMLAAVVAAILVLRQIKQARELAEEQARPYLVPMIESSEADWILMDFVVRNIGSTAARNITMSVDPPYVRSKDVGENHGFMDAAFIAGQTSVLAPGAELRTFLDSGRDLSKPRQGASSFTVTLRYSDRSAKEIVEEFELDPLERMGTVRTEVHGLHHIANSLRAFVKSKGVNSF